MYVSGLTIGIIIVNMVLGVIVPVALAIYVKKNFKAPILALFLGAAGMFLFALILEQIVHVVVLNSPLGATISGNIWLLALYGGLMAGIFEETGRFIIMKFFLKKSHDNPGTALMYGVGHGGFEMLFLLTAGMVNNLVYAYLIRVGQIESLANSLDEAGRASVMEAAQILSDTSPYLFSVGFIERLIAISGQLALSVLVWIAVTKKGEIKYYIIAILLHALVDAVAAIANNFISNVFVVEGIILVLFVGVIIFAKKLWDDKLKD